MKKLYDKSELTLTLILIAVYTISMSLAVDWNKRIGVDYCANMLLCAALTAVLAWFICKNGLQKKYGLCKLAVPAAKFLWFIPLAVLVSRNLWLGTAQNVTGLSLVCYLSFMLFVGFIEEVLFRGMLFRALEKDNRKTAIIVSSVTFGLGHIINLLNGAQDSVLAGVLQVIGAIAIGFLFVIIFDRGGSLWPCIITHSAIDMVSAFANEAAVDANPLLRVLLLAALYIVVGLYALYIIRTVPRKDKPNAESATGTV